MRRVLGIEHCCVDLKKSIKELNQCEDLDGVEITLEEALIKHSIENIREIMEEIDEFCCKIEKEYLPAKETKKGFVKRFLFTIGLRWIK